MTAKPGGAIALMGGTFDPVHYGHLRSALEVRSQLQLNEILFLPAGRPALRSNSVSPAHHRLAMLKLAIEGIAGFRIDDREINREGISYMVDTLAELRCDYPSAPLIVVIGQDSANTLESWHQWQDIFSLAHLVVMSRPGDRKNYPPALAGEMKTRRKRTVPELMSRTAGHVMKIRVTGLSISSSGIRDILRAGSSPRFLLPRAVQEYIDNNGLYQTH